MPIIVRNVPEGKLLREVETSWDKNRKEIDSETQTLSNGVCAILDTRDLEAAGAGYRLKAKTETLESQLRSQIAAGVRDKQAALLEAYRNTPHVQKDFDAIMSMPWPDPSKVDLKSIRFQDQCAPAFGTGFSIGNNYIVTAGHVARKFSNPNVTYWAVFDFSGDNVAKKVFLPSQIYKITRLILLQYPDNPNSTETPDRPDSQIEDIDDYSKKYDFAILRYEPLMALPQGALPPTAFQLPLEPVREGVKICSVGCSSGLSFKYADGQQVTPVDPAAGSIRAIWDSSSQTPLGKKGTIFADVDVFKGNSGGPLFDLTSIPSKANPNVVGPPRVVGICKSGMYYSWIPETPYDTKAELQTRIQAWMETTNAGKGKKVASEFLYSWLQVQPNDSTFTKFSWFRFRPTSIAITQKNAFTRTDPYSYFTTTFNDLQTAGRSVLISFALNIQDNAELVRIPMSSNLTLQIQDSISNPAVVVDTDTLALSSGNVWPVASTAATWTLDSKVANQTGAVGTVKDGLTGGLVNRSLLTWNRGLCAMDTIRLIRSNASKDAFCTSVPASVRVQVIFTVPEATPGAGATTWKFETVVILYQDANPDQWIGQVGQGPNFPRGSIWRGPL